jgi:hypothetical protein
MQQKLELVNQVETFRTRLENSMSVNIETKMISGLTPIETEE